MARLPTLLLTGTIGSGKTVVAADLGILLEERGSSVAVIDLDWLNWIHPRRSPESSDDLLVRNLSAVWPNFVAAGARAFVLTRAVTRPSTIAAIRAGLPDCVLTVARLVASQTVIEDRLRRRDTGAVLSEHLDESDRFTKLLDEVNLADFVVANDDRSVRAVAEDVLELWETA